MKKYSLILLSLIALSTACKKDNDNDNNNNNNNGGNPNNPSVSYTLSITGNSGYFSANPVNVTYNPDEITDVFYGAYKAPEQGTNIRARNTGNSRLVDILFHINGGTGSGTKAIAAHPSVPNSDLAVVSTDANFTLNVPFPEQTPVNITSYSAVNGVIEGEISGTFPHKEITANPYSMTDYMAQIQIKFKVKRSE